MTLCALMWLCTFAVMRGQRIANNTLAVQIKSTPTFLMYRDEALVDTATGTGSGKLLRALLAQLKEGERGREGFEETHSTVDSDDESENE